TTTLIFSLFLFQSSTNPRLLYSFPTRRSSDLMHINELKDIHHHHICTEQYCMFYDSVVLATAFEDTLMQQPIIKQLVKNFNAPVSDAGLPSISSHLEWLPNLFVTGGLADLELGPFARNIMGVREAAAKIATAALS